MLTGCALAMPTRLWNTPSKSHAACRDCATGSVSMMTKQRREKKSRTNKNFLNASKCENFVMQFGLCLYAICSASCITHQSLSLFASTSCMVWAPGPMDSSHRLLNNHFQDTKSSLPKRENAGLKKSIEVKSGDLVCMWQVYKAHVTLQKTRAKAVDNWGSLECHGMQPVLGLQGRTCNATSHLHQTNG